MEDILLTKHITFIGAGAMAEAAIRGLLLQQKVAARQILALNRGDAAKLQYLQATYGIRTGSIHEMPADTLRQADVLILAMKPKDAGQAIADLQNIAHDKQLIISMIAGLSLATIEALLRKNLPVVRTMPNTSTSIGLGATGISFSAAVGEKQRLIATEIFASLGEVTVLDEQQLDILTALSGCGPAYVYYLMEAMIKGGVAGGLSPEAARQLTVQTVLGAASMVRQTEEDPAVLRQKVTSPGGATQAALEVMDRYRFSEAVEQAVSRAAKRSREMGEAIAAEAGKLARSLTDGIK